MSQQRTDDGVLLYLNGHGKCVPPFVVHHIHLRSVPK